jgi:hypothetical protein
MIIAPPMRAGLNTWSVSKPSRSGASPNAAKSQVYDVRVFLKRSGSFGLHRHIDRPDNRIAESLRGLMHASLGIGTPRRRLIAD